MTDDAATNRTLALVEAAGLIEARRREIRSVSNQTEADDFASDVLADLARRVRALAALPGVAEGCPCGATFEHGPHEDAAVPSVPSPHLVGPDQGSKEDTT